MKRYVDLLRFFGLAMFLFACGGGSSTAGSGSDGGDGGGNGGHVDSGGGQVDSGKVDSGKVDSGKDASHAGDSGHDGGGPVGDSGHDSGPGTFTIGGTVAGLAGTGLVLQDNNGDNLTVTASGAFTFATPVAPGGAFSVTVLTQPSTPTQTCTVSGGTGTVGSADVTSVMVNCGTDYVIGGTISGLGAGSVVLQDNGGDNLTVTANGTFAFATPVEAGSMYAVTVLTQPSMPTQTCTVSTGSGTVAGANVTSVSVACVTSTYTVGGTVSGLTGTGLALQDNAGDTLMVSASGTFTFATSVASGAAYAVTVLQSPTTPSQACVVTNGSGTVTDANITSVTVTCTTETFTVGGMVTGLAATDTLVLQDNAGDNLTVTASGTFTFATPVASGATYAVTVFSASGVTAQTCTVSGGSGTVVAGNVTSVAINCTTNKYTIGGTVSGLAGKGLVLQDNGGDNLTVTANGAFSFPTPVASDAAYAVTILTQPTTPSQTCVLAAASGTVAAANVTTVTVTCTTNKYTVGGTLGGLAANESAVLQDNAGDNLTLKANGAFTFATSVASASPYAVTVLTNPASPITQTCVVTAGSGTVTGANVTSVVVTCTTNTCPAATMNNCVLTTTNSGSTDTGTCAAGFVGSCSFACSTVFTQVTDTCVACYVAGTKTFAYSGATASFTVPCGVTSVTIEGWGGQGGNDTFSAANTGGKGADIKGTFAVTPGQVLTVLAGGQGADPANSLNGGGGGGSFVWDPTNTAEPLLAAGGGGGAGSCGEGTPGAGLATLGGGGAGGTCGNNLTCNPNGTGGGGAGWLSGGAGAGLGSPSVCNDVPGSQTPLQGGAGGTPYNYSAMYTSGVGGFGGGGGGGGNCGGGGGGGGYTGGNGSANVACGNTYATSVGGTSYNAGTSQTNTGGVQSGNGQVVLTW